ncbi:phospholipase D-like domain-containing protein [Mucilaginibacter sp. dw_454]|uniref:phospholipase D-like domain-containing protein n=1 Tax=Mucilaginibacter sp. dw_454 TaxID=2720079 RepID=UPI001BD1E78E|nr:phospholipase D-like domain-containing protein [Mucilaginibacter sp. dw_454]
MATLPPFEVYGSNNSALFTLKIFRGEGMVLLGMDWREAEPPLNFVGFAIEYKEPAGAQFYPLDNRLSFLDNKGNVNPNILSTRLSPIQKFRWTHFPYHPDLEGDYTYRVTPVFMDGDSKLSYGESQEAGIAIQGETYPGILNIAFTRGFVASQAFSQRFNKDGNAATILPGDNDAPLTYVSPNPLATQALEWMGFEARKVISDILDAAIADPSAQVRVTAYDLNLPEIVDKLEQLGTRLKIIIDNSVSKPQKPNDHGASTSSETAAENRLVVSAGRDHVQRQYCGDLQHGKTIAVIGNNQSVAFGGSTNFSWRGFFVQNNNTAVVYGKEQVQLFFDNFDNLYANPDNPSGFSKTASAKWTDLGLNGIKASIAFSPHNSTNACLQGIADSIDGTTSSFLFSLAFLYQTKGVIRDAVIKVTNTPGRFVYGISDKKVGGLDLKVPDGNLPVAFPAALIKNVPQPYVPETTGGSGIRMHHKFVVIDFDKPAAKVYLGSHNFSISADLKNGENLWLIEDRRVAVAYMIEAVSMFDHYEWRDAVQNAKKSSAGRLFLKKPPVAGTTDQPWWKEDYTDPQKLADRILFSKVV